VLNVPIVAGSQSRCLPPPSFPPCSHQPDPPPHSLSSIIGVAPSPSFAGLRRPFLPPRRTPSSAALQPSASTTWLSSPSQSMPRPHTTTAALAPLHAARALPHVESVAHDHPLVAARSIKPLPQPSYQAKARRCPVLHRQHLVPRGPVGSPDFDFSPSTGEVCRRCFPDKFTLAGETFIHLLLPRGSTRDCAPR
jgi:hypothetical protein